MRKAEIKVGGHYIAKVSNRIVTVRVDEIVTHALTGATNYKVTNLSTNRQTTFKSAAKFRKPSGPAAAKIKRIGWDAAAEEIAAAERRAKAEEGKQRHNPTPAPSAQPPQAVGPTDTTDATATTISSGSPKGAPPTETLEVRPGSLAEKLAGRKSEPEDTAPHLIIEARAGTGKTTTLIAALQVLKGTEPTTVRHLPGGGRQVVTITPSPQQLDIWNAVALSKGARAVCFVAFNKSIAEELKTRVPAGCEAMTMHSMGFRAVTNTYGRGLKVNSYRVQDILAELLEKDIRDLRRDKATVIKATEELVGLCKMNLVGHAGNSGGGPGETYKSYGIASPEELDQLTSHYDVELNGQRQEVYDLVPRVLERCKDVERDKCLDFNDMIWLPVALNLPVAQYDLLLVDEAQDLNRCQQSLAKRAGKRLVLCGDPKQAIYGFAGADSKSMKRMEEELRGYCPQCKGVGVNGETPCDYCRGKGPTSGIIGRGCVVLPLTVTRRCGKAIVEEARRTVPEFEAHETNPEGTVYRRPFKGRAVGTCPELPENLGYADFVKEGDFILCRCNAPLVSQCFRFIRQGRKANIQGRDVGAGLISTLKKTCGVNWERMPVAEVIQLVTDWQGREKTKEQAKRNPSETRLTAIDDRADCLLCFCEDAADGFGVVRKIEEVFTDDKTSPGIKLSSIHRAKGLEARRVFYLLGDGEKSFGPPPDKLQDWELEQERNLRYVAITRAIEELIYVG